MEMVADVLFVAGVSVSLLVGGVSFFVTNTKSALTALGPTLLLASAVAHYIGT